MAKDVSTKPADGPPQVVQLVDAAGTVWVEFEPPKQVSAKQLDKLLARGELKVRVKS